VEDREDVLFVVLEILDAARGLDGRAEGTLEPVGVELRFIAVQLLGEGDDGLAIQRMGGLILQVSRIRRNSEDVRHNHPNPTPSLRPVPPPPERGPAVASDHERRECNSVLVPVANSLRRLAGRAAVRLGTLKNPCRNAVSSDRCGSTSLAAGADTRNSHNEDAAKLREWYEASGPSRPRDVRHVPRAYRILSTGAGYESVPADNARKLRVELSLVRHLHRVEPAVARCGFGGADRVLLRTELVASRIGAASHYASRSTTSTIGSTTTSRGSASPT
jgi:hypothetical protein